MSKEKQIEEMARCICERDDGDICTLDRKQCDCKCTSGSIAELLYERGYRKQSEVVSKCHYGVRWMKNGNKMTCSYCGFTYYSNNEIFNYCPNCGHAMRGAKDEEQAGSN